MLRAGLSSTEVCPKQKTNLEEQTLLKSLLNRIWVDWQLFEAGAYWKSTLSEYLGNTSFQ